MSAPEKEKRSYELQTGVLESMQEEAVKTDRSLSYLIQEMWQGAQDQIAGLTGLADLQSETAGQKTKQTVFGPLQMHDQIEQKAKQLGCSPGHLIEAVWKLSRK